MKNNIDDFLNGVRFNSEGLVPAVIQDGASGRVLMVAYMNEESVRETLMSGKTVFWSRSRGSLWRKGATSGSEQTVLEIRMDCDGDALLFRVAQKNGACHTGKFSCFYRAWETGRLVDREEAFQETGQGAAIEPGGEILEKLYAVILERQRNAPENSYVASLFSKGQDAILKKVAEEAGEVLLSSKNNKKEEIVWELADLWFHTLVVMGYHGVLPRELFGELARREGKGGLKKRPKPGGE